MRHIETIEFTEKGVNIMEKKRSLLYFHGQQSSNSIQKKAL